MTTKIESLASYQIAVRYARIAESTAKTPRGIIRAALAQRRATRPADNVLDIIPHIVSGAKRAGSMRMLTASGRTSWISTTRFQTEPNSGKRNIRIPANERARLRSCAKYWPANGPTWKPRENRWTDAQREDKRALADPKFRASFIRRLRKTIDAACALPDTAPDAISVWWDSRHTRASQYATSAHRIRACAPRTKLPELPCAIPVARPIPINEEVARMAGAKLDMRGKDASVEATIGFQWLSYTEPETEWKNGRAVKYTRAERINYVRSMGIVLDGGATLHAVIARLDLTIQAPDGHSWAIDEHGLALVRISDRCEYHPDAGDLIRGADLPAIVQRNEERRQMELTRIRAEMAEVDGVWVCLADSVRGGNCRAGSIQWASSHRVDSRVHHRATDILPMAANGSAQRVRIAISAAARRHRQEMERGYCSLADHVA